MTKKELEALFRHWSKVQELKSFYDKRLISEESNLAYKTRLKLFVENISELKRS